ncbi:hypothetical protein HKD37_01G000312 [Glycine soja]
MWIYFVVASCVFRFRFLLNILLEYAIDYLFAWIGIFLACNVHTNGSWDYTRGGGLYFWERTPVEYEAPGYKLCLGMEENSKSALSTNKEAISNATRNLMESLILAQDERWQHALHMQVGREVVFPVTDG